MDTLPEKFENGTIHETVTINDQFSIGCLAWVDDVLTITLGKVNQQSIPTKVNDFSEGGREVSGDAGRKKRLRYLKNGSLATN